MTGHHDARVRQQFGATAENYRTSASHARGASLERLMTLVRPQPDWMVLDTATGAGHTAACLAPRTRLVVAGDMTREMLQQADILCREKALDNVRLVQENSQALSYRDAVFDLVCCRVAAHHFPDPAAFVSECARVLKPGGLLALIDNVVPDNTDAAAWMNDFERQRDPSHARCLTPEQWQALYRENGLAPIHDEVNPKWFDFEDWMQRMHVPQPEQSRLAASLLAAPAPVREFWQPGENEGRLQLALQEAILIGRRTTSASTVDRV